jgi:hypothetical protein
VSRRIFAHDIMSCTAEGVLGNHLYSGRALGLSEPGDIVLLHPALRQGWESIQAHYRRIGLSHSQEILWDIDLRRLRDFPDHELSVFFFGPNEHRARPNPAWLNAVADINSKNRFMHHAERLEVPIPSTCCFDDVAAIGAAELAACTFPCYIKAAVSVSGVGIFRCADQAALGAACQQFAPGTPVQIQQEVRADSFLNMQYLCEDSQVRRLAATEQILDGYVHQGNRHPTPHAPWELLDPLAAWLGEAGLRGVFAFDVAACGSEFLAIECNPRFNGASYPTLIAAKLGVPAWLAQAFSTRHRRLADLDLRGLEYDPQTGTGVVLVNWGPIQVGKLLALIAGDPEVQQQLVDEFQRRL